MNGFLIYLEDNPAEQLIMKYAFDDLNTSNCELICFSSGEEFLEFLNFSGKHAHRVRLTGKFLILIDVNLGSISGFEVLKSLKYHQGERAPDLTAMMMSSSRRDTEIKLANQLGAKDFITKPLDYGGVKDIIQKLLTEVIPLENPLTL